MRGKLQLFGRWFLVIRITPAGAGKTKLDIVIAVAVEDHPRRCGENGIDYAQPAIGDGSPPQVRGKLFAVA